MTTAAGYPCLEIPQSAEAGHAVYFCRTMKNHELYAKLAAFTFNRDPATGSIAAPVMIGPIWKPSLAGSHDQT